MRAVDLTVEQVEIACALVTHMSGSEIVVLHNRGDDEFGYVFCDEEEYGPVGQHDIVCVACRNDGETDACLADRLASKFIEALENA